jgi:hypothetical protein
MGAEMQCCRSRMMSEFCTSLRYGFKLAVAMFLLHEIRGQNATKSSVNGPIVTLKKTSGS